jgi:predicted PurR-regulated permease PerM
VVTWVNDTISKAWPSIQSGLTKRLSETVPGIASFLIGIFIGFFILIFILGDDGSINNWIAGHLGVPHAQGEAIMNEVVASIRGYFRGTTIIAIVDSILIVPAVLLLRVPLVGPIALVTFVTCYIPSFGGYIGGAFAVFITIASQGFVAGIIMLVYAILLHTVMQGPVQAVAYGKTLHMHPLVALLVTLLGAVFAGIAGAILAVPLTAIVLKVSALVKRVQAEGGLSPGDESPPSTPDNPASPSSEPA